MNRNEMDVNKQIKEKLKMFHEIDRSTRPMAVSDKNKSIPNQITNGKVNLNINNNVAGVKNDNYYESLNKDKIPYINKDLNKLVSRTNLLSKDTNCDIPKESNFLANSNLNDGCVANNHIDNIKKSVSFNNIDATRFLTKNNNNQLMNKNNKKINLEENLGKIIPNSNKKKQETINSKSKSKDKTANKSVEKTFQENTNSINNKNLNNNQQQVSSPIRSILKNSSKDKLYNDEKFVPFHETINLNSDFLKRNKKIIFNDIEQKLILNNTNSTMNNLNANLNQRDTNNINKNNQMAFSPNNLEKSNYSNYFPNHSPIRDWKSPLFSSSFVNESDGMNNIFLNKDKNLTILNLERLYQGSFNKEFCELYSNNNNNNNIQNDSTMNKTMQQTMNQNNFNSNNFSKSDLKGSNFSLNGQNMSKKNENENNVITESKNNINIIGNNYNNNNANRSVPIQELNKFFTKRANYNNLNYFSHKKTENSKSRENYNTNENKRNILLQTSGQKTFNINLDQTKSNSNQKALNSSNNREFPTFNNNNQPKENDILIQPALENKNTENFVNNNKNYLFSDKKLNESDNDFFNEEENNKGNINTAININNRGNFLCKYSDYNSPFSNEKDDSQKYFEKLSNYHFIYNNKLEKIRKEEHDKRCKSSNPMLSKKAQNIIREGQLFHCRLYPYHKIQNNNSNKKPNHAIRNTYYNHNHNNININNIHYYNSTNNCKSGSFIIENLRRLEGIEDIKTYKIYRTSKNQDFLNLDKENKSKVMNKSYNNMSCSLNLDPNYRSNLIHSVSILGNTSQNFKRMNSLNRSFNCPNNSKNPFTFKPNLNHKSLNIAEKLKPAFIRLTEKASYSRKQENINIENNQNIKSRDKSISNINPNFSYDAILVGRNTSNNSRNYYKAGQTRTNSKSEFSRSFELYRRGVQRIKKKEALHVQKILNESEAYKQFPFKPQINKNCPAMLLAARIYKNENIDSPNDQVSNIHNINYGIYLNKANVKSKEKNISWNNDKKITLDDDSNKSNKIFEASGRNPGSAYYSKFIPDGFFSNKSEKNDSSNTNIVKNKTISFYDKNIYWKQSVLKKFNRMRDEKETEHRNIHTFKPQIYKAQMTPDARFIEKNIDQIQEYVNKRRSYLQKTNEDLKYKKSKYNFGENFKIKTTIPQEFNLSYKASQEKLLSRSASNLLRGNRNNEALNLSANKTITRKNSKEVASFSNAYVNNSKNVKKIDMSNLRNNLKIKEFFEFDEIITNDSSKENKENEGGSNSKNLVNNKRSADLFSKNKTFATQNLNRSFNNLPMNHKTSYYKAAAAKSININNVNQEVNLPINCGSEYSVSDQYHNLPRDNYYHHNDLNDFDIQFAPNVNENTFNNNYGNFNVYNNPQAAVNLYNQINLGNVVIEPNNNGYANNLQVNNYFIENANKNFGG